MKENGEIITIINWLRQSGYEVNTESLTITRRAGCKRKDYLENRASLYGFTIAADPEAKPIKRQSLEDDLRDIEHLKALAIEKERKLRADKRRRMMEEAWKRVQQADPNKVIGKLLNTVPLTEREQRLIEYYSLAFQGTERGRGLKF